LRVNTTNAYVGQRVRNQVYHGFRTPYIIAKHNSMCLSVCSWEKRYLERHLQSLGGVSV